MISLAWSREGGFIPRSLHQGLVNTVGELTRSGKLLAHEVEERRFPVGEQVLTEAECEEYFDALCFLRHSDYKQAVNRLVPLLNRYPEVAGFHYAYGLALRRLDDLAEAEAQFCLAAGEVQWSHTVLNDLAILMLEVGRVDDALYFLHLAEAARPGTKETSFNLGLAMYTLGYWERAAAYFEETLRRQPVYVKAAYMQGLALGKCGLNNAARDVLETASAVPAPEGLHRMIVKSLEELS